MGKPVIFFSLAVAFIAVLGTACSDDPKRPAVLTDGTAHPGQGGGGGTGDGGTSEAGPTTDAGDGGTCTDLENTGFVVDESVVNDDLPAGIGGTITDGTYDITSVHLHQGGALPGPTGNSYQGAIRVTGPTYERIVAFKSSAGAGSEVHGSGTLTPSGINATIALTCPSATQEQVTYSVLNDTLTVSNLVTKASFVFTKRL